MFNRIILMIVLLLKRDGDKRGKYLKERKIIKAGENFWFYPWNLPAEPENLIFGNNVCVAANVKFITHDVIGFMLNNYDKNHTYGYKTGKINIGNNVAIGRDVIILPNIKINDETIIAAGSIVTKDFPSGVVIGGNPAREIGKFSDFIVKRKRM